VDNQGQYNELLKLQESGHVDFWKDPCMNCKSDLMVAPHQNAGMMDFFTRNDFKYTVLVDNVEE